MKKEEREDSLITSSTVWDVTSQTVVITKHDWRTTARIISDLLFVGINMGSLIFVVVYSQITPGNRLGNVFETVLAFACGIFGYAILFIISRSMLGVQSAYSVGDSRGMIRSLLCFAKW